MLLVVCTADKGQRYENVQLCSHGQSPRVGLIGSKLNPMKDFIQILTLVLVVGSNYGS